MRDGERGAGQDTSRGLSNLALLIPLPVYLLETFERGSVWARVWAGGGVGRVEKVDCHCCASFSGMVNRQKGAHNTTFTIHHSPSRIAQTCTANFGSFFQCGFCCQPLKLEGRCLNSLTRSSALTQNAAVSSTPTNFFLLLVTAALSS